MKQEQKFKKVSTLHSPVASKTITLSHLYGGYIPKYAI